VICRIAQVTSRERAATNRRTLSLPDIAPASTSENHPSRTFAGVGVVEVAWAAWLDCGAAGRQAGRMPDPIPLATAIRVLREQLQDAVRAGEGEELRFALGPVELELQVEAAHEGGGEAGIKFWLVSIGAKGGRSSSTTHTVRLSLTPVRVDDAGNQTRDVLVASKLEARG